MDPVSLKTMITYISNYFFCSLKEKEFFNLGLFLSILSKEMLEMSAIRELCEWEKGKPKKARKEHKDNKEGGDSKDSKGENENKKHE